MSDALKRVFEAANCRTQLELAAILDVRQSAISDTKRRGAIPPEWLIKLLYLRGINPAWIMDGIGPKFLAPSGDTADINYPYETFSPVRARAVETARKAESAKPCHDNAVDELGSSLSGIVRCTICKDAAILRRILRCFPVRDLADELRRREAPTS